MDSNGSFPLTESPPPGYMSEDGDNADSGQGDGMRVIMLGPS
jgi:hypothetical protein